MSNMQVLLKERNDKECRASFVVVNARLGYFANPTELSEVHPTIRQRYDGQFHLDKDAEGAAELIAMLFEFQELQSTKTKQVSICLKDGDDYAKDKKGNAITGNAGTWIISAYRQKEQELGKIIDKKAYKEGDIVPAGYAVYMPVGKRAFVAKTLTTANEISGNDIVNIQVSIYTTEKTKGVFACWEVIQLVKHVGKNNRGNIEDFADFPDTEDENSIEGAQVNDVGF
jgi:hypothetical protein